MMFYASTGNNGRKISTSVVGKSCLRTVFIRHLYRKAEIVEYGTTTVSFGVHYDIQLLELIVMLVGNTAVSIHYLVNQLIVVIVVFRCVPQSI